MSDHRKQNQQIVEIGRTVYTDLGQGRVVYQLPDGTFLVEFPWGGGQIMLPHQIMGGVNRMPHGQPSGYEQVPVGIL